MKKTKIIASFLSLTLSMTSFGVTPVYVSAETDVLAEIAATVPEEGTVTVTTTTYAPEDTSKTTVTESTTTAIATNTPEECSYSFSIKFTDEDGEHIKNINAKLVQHQIEWTDVEHYVYVGDAKILAEWNTSEVNPYISEVLTDNFTEYNYTVVTDELPDGYVYYSSNNVEHNISGYLDGVVTIPIKLKKGEITENTTPLSGTYSLKINVMDIVRNIPVEGLDCELFNIQTGDVAAKWNTSETAEMYIENLEYSFDKPDSYNGNITYAIRITNLPENYRFFYGKTREQYGVSGFSLEEFKNGTDISCTVYLEDTSEDAPKYTYVTTVQGDTTTTATTTTTAEMVTSTTPVVTENKEETFLNVDMYIRQYMNENNIDGYSYFTEGNSSYVIVCKTNEGISQVKTFIKEKGYNADRIEYKLLDLEINAPEVLPENLDGLRSLISDFMNNNSIGGTADVYNDVVRVVLDRMNDQNGRTLAYFMEQCGIDKTKVIIDAVTFDNSGGKNDGQTSAKENADITFKENDLNIDNGTEKAFEYEITGTNDVSFLSDSTGITVSNTFENGKGTLTVKAKGALEGKNFIKCFLGTGENSITKTITITVNKPTTFHCPECGRDVPLEDKVGGALRAVCKDCYEKGQSVGTTIPTETEESVSGDANCDGVMNMADAVLIMQSVSNPDKYGLNGTDASHITEQGKKNADIAGENDGITNADALAIQRRLLNLE